MCSSPLQPKPAGFARAVRLHRLPHESWYFACANYTSAAAKRKASKNAPASPRREGTTLEGTKVWKRANYMYVCSLRSNPHQTAEHLWYTQCVGHNLAERQRASTLLHMGITALDNRSLVVHREVIIDKQSVRSRNSNQAYRIPQTRVSVEACSSFVEPLHQPHTNVKQCDCKWEGNTHSVPSMVAGVAVPTNTRAASD